MRNRNGESNNICKSLLVLLVILLICAGTVFAKTEPIPINNESDRVALTAEEQAFMTEHPVVTVAVDASWRPLEYLDTNTKKYSGVIPEVLKRLETYTGFRFRYKVMNSYAEALDAVATGKADMISGLANDKEMAKEYNVLLSKPYLTINSAVVSKDNARDLYRDIGTKKIAVVDGDYANPAIAQKIPKAVLDKYPSNELCLDAVKEEKVDVAIIAAYCAEYYMRVPKYSSLNSYSIADFSWQQSFGINANSNKALVSILDKGIDKMSSLDVNHAVYDGLMGATYEHEWMIFLYKHSAAIFAGIMFIVIIISILLAIIYINRRKAHQRKLEDGLRLSMALARTHLCIWEIDWNTGNVLSIDNAHEKHGFYNLREDVFDQAAAKGYIHPEDVKQIEEMRNKIMLGEQNIQCSWRIRNNPDVEENSTYWWEQVLFHVIYNRKGNPLRVIGVSEDITKEKLAQKDSLTSVYNRKSFETAASRILTERRNAYLQCAFLILDLDGFKQINDTYGHKMGDKVLVAVGNTLTNSFRTSDIVGRLGGDEFIVFMTSISKKEDAILKAEILLKNIANIQSSYNLPCEVKGSLGVVITEKGKDDLEAMYEKADIALYKAKNAGKNQYMLYENN